MSAKENQTKKIASSDLVCDHTSVGMIVWKNNNLLLIQRKRFPFGYAIPAGHVDGDASYEIAAKRELKEEVGLNAIKLECILEEDTNNKCRRKYGIWHHWKIYEVIAEGDIIKSEDEAKNASFYSTNEVNRLAGLTEKYLANKISDIEWEKSPGLELCWYYHAKKLNITGVMLKKKK